MNDDIEQQVIVEDYKIWRKNVPHLYDFMYSHILHWPSLVVEYFPDVSRDEQNGKTIQKLLMTSNTGTKNQDEVCIASVEFPDKYDESLSEDYRREIRFKIHQSIPLLTSVNTVRYNPTAWHILAVKDETQDVRVYDCTRHLSRSETAIPQITCKGHTKGGWGLAWNPLVVSEFVSGGNDNKLCVFDISTEELEIKPKSILTGHTASVNDVCYSRHSPVLLSVSDDKSIRIWDTRTNIASCEINDAHDSDVLSVEMSSISLFYFATSSQDKTIKIWDTRSTKNSLHVLRGHSDSVERVRWCPHVEGVVASASRDRRIILWDLSKIGTAHSDQDLPGEMMFIHGGHTDSVSDISWNPSELYEIASVAEDNILQIWQIPEDE